MASIKDDVTAFEQIKEKTRPRYKKTWFEFKDEVKFFSSAVIFLNSTSAVKKK